MSTDIDKRRSVLSSLFGMVFLSFLLPGCDSNKGQDTLFLFVDVPTVSPFGAIIQCRMEAQDDWTISEKGLYWSASPNPEATGTLIDGGTGMGPLTCVLTGLAPATTYYLKYYVKYSGGTITLPDGIWTNEYTFGTGAHKEIVFAASPVVYDSFTDAEGNRYKTVQIGTQTWMAENLKVRKYRDGTDIPELTSESGWSGTTTAAACDYYNAAGHSATYGRLYNWAAVQATANLCPAGWHIPTDDEWKQLELALGMTQTMADQAGERGTKQGERLREYSNNHWKNDGGMSTTPSGFTALPGGYRDAQGRFLYMEKAAFWWTATESGTTQAWFRGITVNPTLTRNLADKRDGYSIRCVRD